MEDTMDTNCTLTEEEKDIVVYVILGTSGFALLCSLIVLLIMLLFKKYLVSSQRLILYLMLTVALKQAMLVTLAASSGYNHVLPYCITAGFFNQQLTWYLPMAIYCLTFELFVKAVFQQLNTEKYEKWYVIIIFLLPFTFNWLPFINEAYGINGAVCWIRARDENCTLFPYGIAMQFGLFWAPFFVSMICILAACIWALVVTKRRRLSYNGTFDPGEHHFKNQLEKDVHHYLLYPVVYLLINLVQPVRLIIAAKVESLHNTLPFYLIHSVVQGLEGAMICLAFLLSYIARRELWWGGGLRAAIFSIRTRDRVTTYNAIQESDVTDSLRKNNRLGSQMTQ